MQQKDLQLRAPKGLAPRKVSKMNERSARAMLGVSLSATTGQIKRAYRRLALELHPDRGGDPAAFQRLVEAQSFLLARPMPTIRPRRVEEWIETSTDSDRCPTGPRSAYMKPARRRPAAPKPARQRCFGDVLAEKLAAA